MTFYDWLMTQTGRDDPVGDLALDVAGDTDAPISGDFGAWKRYLSPYGPHVRSALAEAWLGYRGAAAFCPPTPSPGKNASNGA